MLKSEVTRDKLNRTRHCCLAMVDIIFIAPYKAMGIMEGRYDDETYCLQLVFLLICYSDLISFPATLTRFSDTLTIAIDAIHE